MPSLKERTPILPAPSPQIGPEARQKFFLSAVKQDFPEHYLNMQQRCCECAARVETEVYKKVYTNKKTGLFVCSSCWVMKHYQYDYEPESILDGLLRMAKGVKEDKDYIYPGSMYWLLHVYKPAYELFVLPVGWVVFDPFSDLIWVEPTETTPSHLARAQQVECTEDIQSYVKWVQDDFPQHSRWNPDG